MDKGTSEIVFDSCLPLFLMAIDFQNQRPHHHPSYFIVFEYRVINSLPEQFNMIELTPTREGKLGVGKLLKQK